MPITFAESRHCAAIARMHREGIPTGFLPRLGERFLRRLYQGMIHSQYGVLLVSVSDTERVDGFVCAAGSTKRFYIDFFLSANGLGCVLEILRRIFSKSSKQGDYPERPGDFLKKCRETLLYPLKQDQVFLPEAELLAIVVDREKQGTGVAGRLLKELKYQFFIQGIGRFKVVVGRENRRACRFYQKEGGRNTAGIEVHAGEVSNVYVFETGR